MGRWIVQALSRREEPVAREEPLIPPDVETGATLPERRMEPTRPGTVAEDGTMTLERSSGGTVAKETRAYPKAALMPEGMDLEVRRHGFVSGTSYELISFVAEYASGARTSRRISGIWICRPLRSRV